MLFFTEDTGFPKYFGAPPGNIDELSKLNQHYADIAASIQKVTEDIAGRHGEASAQNDRDEEFVHGRRRGPELRGQHAHPARVGF